MVSPDLAARHLGGPIRREPSRIFSPVLKDSISARVAHRPRLETDKSAARNRSSARSYRKPRGLPALASADATTEQNRHSLQRRKAHRTLPGARTEARSGLCARLGWKIADAFILIGLSGALTGGPRTASNLSGKRHRAALKAIERHGRLWPKPTLRSAS